VAEASRDWWPLAMIWARQGQVGQVAGALARPTTVDEVANVSRLCHEARVPLTPAGGRSSVVGGAIPVHGGVLVDLTGLSGIGEVDIASGIVEVAAGTFGDAFEDELQTTYGLTVGHWPQSMALSTVGGWLACRGAGQLSNRYGKVEDLVVGLEVVLPDGTIWNGLRAVQKDNAGYQLRKLFCGAEGTLGVVTRAVLRLHPAPRQRLTALVALPSLAAAVTFGTGLSAEAGEFLQAMEFFSETGLDLALRHVAGLDWPLDSRAKAYLLLELGSGSPRVALDEIATALLEQGMEQGLILDGALAASGAQRAAFWRLREEQPEGQRREGPQLKHDISVPPARIAEFVDRGEALCNAALPGVRINPFGHLGDGNIHYNLTPPEGRADFAGQDAALANALAALATDMGGSFAAEHGLGRSKTALADALRPPAERALHRRIKAALDPAGQMNPGVIVQPIDKNNLSI